MAALPKPTNGSNADYAARIGALFDAYNNGNYQFPATQVPSADPNTLDDYEEVSGQAFVVTPGSGALGAHTATIDYTKIGREIFWQASIAIVDNSSAATYLKFTFPFTVNGIAPFTGWEIVNGILLAGYINTTDVFIYTYASAYPGGAGRTLWLRGACRV